MNLRQYLPAGVVQVAADLLVDLVEHVVTHTVHGRLVGILVVGEETAAHGRPRILGLRRWLHSAPVPAPLPGSQPATQSVMYSSYSRSRLLNFFKIGRLCVR